METIFDIFGSRESVKPSPLNLTSQTSNVVKGISPIEAEIPGKQVIKNGGSILKGKRVLGDVGNKIKSLNKKSECTSQEAIKKPLKEQCTDSKVSPKENLQKSENAKEVVEREDTMPVSHVTEELSFISKDTEELPEVETQGPSFWADDDYDSIWSNEEKPSIEDFCRAANIWDIDLKSTVERSPSPVSEDMHDDLDYCLNLPTLHCEKIVLEEETIPFPWEM